MSCLTQLCSPSVVGIWVSGSGVAPVQAAGNVGVVGSWGDAAQAVVFAQGIASVAVAMSAPVQAIVSCAPSRLDSLPTGWSFEFNDDETAINISINGTPHSQLQLYDIPPP